MNEPTVISGFLRKERRIQNAVSIACFFALAILLFRKCCYGFGNDDETFYLTIPYRFAQGDAMFRHEWNGAQMSGFLMIPLMKLYLAVSGGSTVGMVLAFRRIYTAVQLLAGLGMFAVLRKYDWLGALLGCLCWTIYAPFCISALSYNTIAIISLTTALTLLACTENRFLWMLAGLLYAGAVLCCPYLAAPWFLILCALPMRRRIFKDTADAVTCRFGYLTVGVVILAILFLVTVFSRIRLSDLFLSIGQILNDPDHRNGFADKIAELLQSLMCSGKTMVLLSCAYAVLGIAVIFAGTQRNKQLCLIAAFVLTGIHLCYYAVCFQYPNHIMYPIHAAAFFCCWITRRKSLRRFFWGMWVPGMLYTVCAHFGSNQGLYAITSASSVSIIASVLIIVLTVRAEISAWTLKMLKPVFLLAAAGVLALQLGLELYFRWNTVYRDAGVDAQTVFMADGPEAGIFAAEDKAQMYQIYLDELEIPGESVLFFSDNCWLYLCGDWKNASFSSWLPGFYSGKAGYDHCMDKLEAYYEANPDKKPEYVYLDVYLDSKIADYEGVFEEKWGYTPDRVLNSGCILLKKNNAMPG